MNFARTPDNITARIRELCQQVSPGAEPVFIRIAPDPGCKPLDCFECVRRKVEREGGRIQYGWAIWEWPHVYVEAEHHAVFEPPGGLPCLDITPSASSEIKRRLFLPDNTAVYNFENEGILRDNFRLALSDDPLIQEFFAAASKRSAILNAIPGVNVTVNDVDEGTLTRISQAEQLMDELLLALAMKYTPQNAPCFCGSGTKFKRCHGQLMMKRASR
jgi:hypothetical protein